MKERKKNPILTKQKTREAVCTADYKDVRLGQESSLPKGVLAIVVVLRLPKLTLLAHRMNLSILHAPD